MICSSFHLAFSKHFIWIQGVQPYSSTDKNTAWKNFYLILSEKSDIYEVINLSITIYA